METTSEILNLMITVANKMEYLVRINKKGYASVMAYFLSIRESLSFWCGFYKVVIPMSSLH